MERRSSRRWLTVREPGDGRCPGAGVAASANDESVLDAAFRDFDEHGPGNVYLKSRPSRTADAVLARVTLSARGSSADAADDLLREAVALLRATLDRHGVQVLGVDFDGEVA